MQAIADRRKNARRALRCRVSFYRKSSFPIAEGVTQDLSSGGFYCLSPMPLTVGESLTCLLKMPSPNASYNHALTLECVVRVVRLDNGGEEGTFGIACRIEGYHAYSAERARYKVCVV
jgi:hypothetical protein